MDMNRHEHSSWPFPEVIRVPVPRKAFTQKVRNDCFSGNTISSGDENVVNCKVIFHPTSTEEIKKKIIVTMTIIIITNIITISIVTFVFIIATVYIIISVLYSTIKVFYR